MHINWRHQIAMDDQGRLLEDIPCRRCGYNLRQQTLQGQCPECSTPISDTLRPDLLRFADPAWVRRLARGVIFLAIGWLMQTLVSESIFLAGWMRKSPTSYPYSEFIVAAESVRIAAWLTMLAGVWMIATQAPRGYSLQVRTAPPRLLRWLWSATVLFSVAGHVIAVIWPLTVAKLPRELMTVAYAMNSIGRAFYLAALFAVFALLFSTAQRLPNHRLARWLGIPIVAFITLIGVRFVYDLLTISDSGMRTLEGYVAEGVLFGTPELLLTPWIFVLLLQLSRELKTAANQSEKAKPAGRNHLSRS